MVNNDHKEQITFVPVAEMMKKYQSIDDEMMSLSSTARPVTWSWWPFKVWTLCPVFKSHNKTSVSIPPETILPSGNFSQGAIQAKGPTKLECPTSVFDSIYLCFFSGSGDQNLTVASLEEVAIPASPHIHILRT